MVDQGVVRLLGLSTSYALVALIFAGLRATGAISWAWLWVLCPLWLPFVLTGIAFASFVIVRLQPSQVIDLQTEAVDFVGRDGAAPKPEHGLRDLCPLSPRGPCRHIVAAKISEQNPHPGEQRSALRKGHDGVGLSELVRDPLEVGRARHRHSLENRDERRPAAGPPG